MSDNNNDDIEDDFDLDDFDEDLGDESWDDFDDGEGVAPEPDTQASPQKDSFVKKNFNLIVIGVIAIAGGIIALGQLTGSSDTAGPPDSVIPAVTDQTTNQFDMPEKPGANDSEIADLSMANDLPPMPTPMNTTIQDEPMAKSVDIPTSETEQATAFEPDTAGGAIASLDSMEDSALTPLPSASVLTENTELAPLDLEENAGTIKDEPTEQVQMDNMSDSDNQEADTSMADKLTPDMLIDDIETLDSIETTTVSDEPMDISAPTMEIAEKPIMQEEIPATQDNNAEEIAAVEEKFKAINEDLENKITEQNQDIDDLKATIKALEKRLAEQEKNQARMAAPAEKEPETAMDKPAPKPMKKTTTKVISKKSSKTWVMKSAQPGQALVSIENSNDIRSVEVGESLEGIGRITFIGLESGKWIIRGTTGTISQ